MPDSTLASARRWRSLASAALLALVVTAALVGAAAPAARADGDPASDVLADQTAFIPAGTNFPPAAVAQLRQVIVSAKKAGYPVRVALIADRFDLGAVTALWNNPKGYAEFLGTELSNIYRGALLVVMPNGYGVWIVGPTTPAEAQLKKLGASLEGAPLPDTGSATAQDAVSAVRRMAASSNINVPAPTATSLPSAGNSLIPGPIGLVALAGGLIVIAAAWALSLRSRPWRRDDGVASPTHGA